MRTLFDYTDYRAYLRDIIQGRREKGLPASNRWFAQKLGINSNAWLTYILQGKRNLSSRTGEQLALLLKLGVNEGRYFDALVHFNQAKSIDERSRWYREMERCRKSGSVRVITSDQYEFYSVWYHSAIRSLIGLHPNFGTFEQLGSMLSPPVTAAEAKKSVLLLERLGLIAIDEKGGYQITDTTITTGRHEKALAVVNFQRETIKLALESFDRCVKEERDNSTMTVGVSPTALEKIKKLLRETRGKIAEIAADDTRSDRVFQINMQVFPFSNRLPIDEHKE
jgi:uncharacterized protein (TIGR02147 family)